MANFIQSLYENEHFTLYLSIILVVLVILFFVVLFFGKKDKKLQETQKLLKVTDSFKEEEKKEKLEVAPEVVPEVSVSPVASEATFEVSLTPDVTMAPDINVDAVNEETLVPPEASISPIIVPEEPTNQGEKDLEKTIVLPVIEENKPVLIPKDNRPIEVIVINPSNDVDVALENEVDPIEIKEEVKDSEEIVDTNLHFDELSNALEKDLTDLENIKKEFNNIELPTIEEHKEVIKPKKAPPVFSSVFAPKIDIATEETDADLDLPTLKTDEEKEISEITPVEESKEENNELPSFSFDNISGETYNLNDK